MFGRKKKNAPPGSAELPAEETAEENPAEEGTEEISAPAEPPKKKRSLFGRKREETGEEELSARQQRKKDKETEKRLKEAEARVRELEGQLNTSEKKRRRARFSDFFAFVVLLAAAGLMVLGPVLKLILSQTGGVEAMSTVSTVVQYCLFAAIALPAWMFVYRKSFGMKIVFVIGVAVYITGSILGLTL